MFTTFMTSGQYIQPFFFLITFFIIVAHTEIINQFIKMFYREHRFIVFIAFLLFEHFIIYSVGFIFKISNRVLIYEKVILQVVGSN